MSREPSSRLKASFVGSIGAFFFGILPLVGPIIGGAMAGYLRGSDGAESALTGALATIIASIPLLLIAGLTGLTAIVGGDSEALVSTILLVVLSGAYFYAFGALGGYIGSAFSNREFKDTA